MNQSNERSGKLAAIHIDLRTKTARALEACRIADEALVVLSLATLCVEAVEFAQDAAVVVLGWSDQGDFLYVAGLENANGEDLDEAHDFYDDEGVVFNLTEYAQGYWLPFMTADHEDTDRATFRLLVNATMNALVSDEASAVNR
jgi:hypothetical protein